MAETPVSASAVCLTKHLSRIGDQNVTLYELADSGSRAVWTANVRSYWVRVRGATVTISLPYEALFDKVGLKYGMRVDRGAFVASNSGAPCKSVSRG